MSEAVAKTPRVESSKRINWRKALAGIKLLEGHGSLKQCLIDSGFAEHSARKPQDNGLAADRCLAEAAKLGIDSNPAKMLEAAREKAMLAIAACDPNTVALKDAMKMLDVIEKYHGGHEIAAGHAITSLTDRLTGMVVLLAVARERGLPVPMLPASFIDAEIVPSVATARRKRKVSTEVVAVSSDGTET
mgnify:CR=1 FL=1